MVNPDGVIFGNYRTNLAGFDLNRKWDGIDNYQVFPEISAIKTFIADLHK
jgi:murein tripeptide amidase MpaA